MLPDPKNGTSIRILDVHHHLAAGEGTDRPDVLSRRIQLMDSFGIDAACLMPPSGAFGDSASMEDMNDATASVCGQHPDRFPAGLIHLDLSHAETTVLAELERAHSQLGLHGVVFHHRFQGVFLDHPTMVSVLRRCADRGLTVFIHVVGESTLESAWRLEALIEKAGTNSPIVALDAFSSSDRAFDVLRLCIRKPNVFVDLGAMNAAVGYALDAFLGEIGPERILVGTDLYMEPTNYHFPFAIHEALHLELDTGSKQQMLDGNARRLLGLPTPL
ncbi:MAG: uncharacterized protein QOI95_2013 [Acidimicrobiaceae bacterium]|jgi:predicted TIM-barrel fold metal-dependent hydrolase